MRKLILIMMMLLIPFEALAKKVYNYVPPPYFERFLRSMAALLPTAFLFGFTLYFCHSLFDRAGSSNKKTKWNTIIFLLALTGSFLAASDSVNCGSWNPALYGGVVIALMAPLSFLILNHKLNVVMKGILVILSYPILGFVILVSTWYWTYFGTGLFGYLFGWRLVW